MQIMYSVAILSLFVIHLGSCIIYHVSYSHIVHGGSMNNPSQLASSSNNQAAQDEKLLLANLINRHSDRAPLDFSPLDRHAEKTEFFWPRGLNEITHGGEVRMYNLGLALRRMYRELGFGDYDTNGILALTSNVTRCMDSQRFALEGFYEITDKSLVRGRQTAKLLRNKQVQSIQGGHGSMTSWKQIQMNTDLVRSLNYNYFDDSKYLADHPSKLQENYENDPMIMSLENIGMLRNLLLNYYKQPFAYTATNLWTGIQTELYLDRTKETIEYMDHFAPWLDDVVKSDGKNVVDLYELYEVVVLMTFVRMYNETQEQYLEIAPIVTSLIESQSVALGEEPPNDRAKNYTGKHTIFYSTHDSVMEMMLFDMGILSLNGSTWADRMLAAKANNASALEMFLQGLKMCNFGLSVKFELWLLGQSYPVVRLSMYDEPDPYAPVVWAPVALGSICRRRYTQMKSDNSGRLKQLEQYYPRSNAAKLNVEYDCPFALFKEVYSQYLLNDTLYERLYNDEQP